jgi:non-specific serine/threonine protein kinase/serine/threonine-protein kinase
VWRTDSHEAVHGSIEITPSSVSAVRDGSAEKLSRCLRGDLDNIVLMALRKEPQRRYASAEQFAEDIRRHLENLPVSASKDTVRYRMSKFIRRHKAGVAAAVVAAVAVFVGLFSTLHEARIARLQQLRAEQRFNDVRELANSLMFDVHDSIQDLPGSTAARKLLVEKALRYLDSLSRDAASDASLRRELALFKGIRLGGM